MSIHDLYASNVAGTGMLALEEWHRLHARLVRTTEWGDPPRYEGEYEQTIGKLTAYAVIVRHLTGRRPNDPLAREVLESVGPTKRTTVHGTNI